MYLESKINISTTIIPLYLECTINWTVYQGEASKPDPQDHLKILDEETGRGPRLDGYRVPVRAPAIEINLSLLDWQYYLSSYTFFPFPDFRLTIVPLLILLLSPFLLNSWGRGKLGPLGHQQGLEL